MHKNTDEILIVKADGKQEAFEMEKLRHSLLNAGAKEESAEKVIAHILPELRNGMTTNEIYRHAFTVLNKINKPIARSYSLRRAILDLGPSGFPFEDFVAEILKTKGFQCQTRQTVLGGCVPHEVDVVAWNDKKLVMVEAKFHNELGTKSDLKVALYIKARVDDLKDNVYDYGGKDRHLDEGWLVTNTKFSSTAIHYGACQKLIMIGWNYPENGSLQKMIEEEGLHPITCLETLNVNDRKVLLSHGVVLCSNIKDNPELLTEHLGSHFDSQHVLAEINELYAD